MRYTSASLWLLARLAQPPLPHTRQLGEIIFKHLLTSQSCHRYHFLNQPWQYWTAVFLLSREQSNDCLGSAGGWILPSGLGQRHDGLTALRYDLQGSDRSECWELIEDTSVKLHNVTQQYVCCDFKIKLNVFSFYHAVSMTCER